MAISSGRRHFLRVAALGVAGAALPAGLRGQDGAARPDPTWARSLMLRLNYQARDVTAAVRFWSTLGATRVAAAEAAIPVMRLGGVDIVLHQAPPSSSSEGSVINHIAFRVPEFDSLITAFGQAGMRTERTPQFPETLNAFTPEGDKVEIFSNRSTSPGFKPAGETTDGVWQRHNAPVQAIAGHHLHFYLPEGQDAAAQQWYLARFGGTPGVRLRYAAIDYPGINLNFSTSTPPAPTAPTKGRSLDRIGFQVRGLEALCRHVSATGTTFTRAYGRGQNGAASALLIDPWGTSIELTEEPSPSSR